MIKKIFYYFIVSLFIYFIIPVRFALAAGEFQADYDVDYAVSPSGTTIVTQNIILTNKLTNLYPKQYVITIDSDKIRNVIASDNGGIITPTIGLKEGKTQIALEFNERVVGLGQKLRFSLRYEHADIARKNGQIWEVNIPGVENDPDLGSYRVSLSVPPSFGLNAYLSPKPADGNFWSKEQMVNGGVSAAYGSVQVFTLDLSYYIENPTVSVKLTEIALPPDTAYQDVAIGRIEPSPVNVQRDKDGNWMARYNLTPGQKLDIQAKLTVSIYLHAKPGWKTVISSPEDYLKPTRYWEVYDNKIRELAQTYRTPRQIYDFVVGTLSYDYNRVNQNPIRRGALGTLVNPKSSICMEFTDLFIALARAAGIPAREIVGFAYTTNSKLRPLSLVSDVLHSWPEYYDGARHLWVPVDPTWANTTGGVNYFDKLDFNHVAFAIHGISSEYPYPAGFYRNSNKTGKDIAVSFAENPQKSEAPAFAVDISFPKKAIAGFESRGTVNITNTSGRNVSEARFSIQSAPGDLNINTVEYDLPPFATIRLPVAVRPSPFFKGGRGRLLVTLNEQSQSYLFEILPIYWLIIPVTVTIFGIGVAVFFITRRGWVWKYFKR